MQYEFERSPDRTGTNCAKWDFMGLLRPGTSADAIPMWVADMDFACAPEIIEALHERVDRDIFGYSSFMTQHYFQAVCGWYQRRFNWYINSSSIVMTRGVVDGIRTLLTNLTTESAGIVIQMPVYYPFFETIRATGRTVVENVLIENDGYYTIDFADLEQKLATPGVEAFLLCSPHNPVGRVWTEAELLQMGALCEKYNVLLISDEIHCDFVHAHGRHIPIATLFPENKRIITCTAPSKTFNLAGMSLSNVIIPDPDLRNKATKGNASILANPLAITAAQAAYEKGEEWVDQLNCYLDGNFAAMKEYLSAHLPRAVFRVPEGTYLGWVNVSAYTDDTRALETELSREAGVYLECGDLFGDCGKGYLRINCACPRDQLMEALRRMTDYLNRVRPGDALRRFTGCGADGKPAAVSAGKKTCLVFLRYVGCTICQLDLRALAHSAAAFAENDVQLCIALQSAPENVAPLAASAPACTFLCDPEGKLYELYSVCPARTREQLASAHGVEKIVAAATQNLVHGAYEGNELQLPAAFCFDEAGRCLLAHYGKDAADLPTAHQLLNAFGQEEEQ